MADNFGSAWADEFSGSPAWTLGQLAVAVILGGKAWYEWAQEKATPDAVFAWMLALLVYSVAVVGFHAWRAWNKEHLARGDAELRLKAIVDATPNILFEKVAHAEITLSKNGTTGDAVEVWELWFRNRPEVQSDASVARTVSAEVTFCDEKWLPLLNTFRAIWAQTAQADHVGWSFTSAATDISTPQSRAKLMLIAQPGTVVSSWSKPDDNGDQHMEDERVMYALAGENLHERPFSADHSPYYLGPAVVRVRIAIAGQNVQEREFRFRLERDEGGTLQSIEEITP